MTFYPKHSKQSEVRWAEFRPTTNPASTRLVGHCVVYVLYDGLIYLYPIGGWLSAPCCQPLVRCWYSVSYVMMVDVMVSILQQGALEKEGNHSSKRMTRAVLLPDRAWITTGAHFRFIYKNPLDTQHNSYYGIITTLNRQPWLSPSQMIESVGGVCEAEEGQKGSPPHVGLCSPLQLM